jgi:dynein heavy chain
MISMKIQIKDDKLE